MPKEFVKDIGDPGEFFTPRGKIRVTDADYDEFIAAWNDMAATSIRVPVPFAHPKPTDLMGFPVASNNQAEIEKRNNDKFTAGWVKDLFRDPTDGKFKVRFDVLRDEDAERIEKVGGFVSPQFGEYTNPETGKKYPKAITHVAITCRPVNPKQSANFTPAVVAMSLDEALAEGPVQAITQMAEEYSEDTDDLYDEHGNGIDDEDEPKPGEKKPSTLEKLRECLKAHHNISLPEGWSPAQKNAMKTLLAAAESSALAERGAGGQQVEGGKQPGKDGKNGQKLRTEPTVLVMSQMSQDAQAKIKVAIEGGSITQEQADTFMELAKTLQLSLDAEKPPAAPPTSPQTQMSQPSPTELAMQRRLTQFAQKELNDRINSAMRSGRCTPATAEKLRQQANQFQFSADADTDPILEAKLALIEEMPAGAVWDEKEKITQMAQQAKFTTEPQPAFMIDDEVLPATEKERDEIVEAELREMGIPNA